MDKSMAIRISKPFVNSQEAAAFLGVSPGTLANWRVHRKNLRFYKIGAGVRYRLKDLAEWVLEGTCEIERTAPTRSPTDDPQLTGENSRRMWTNVA
jgi:excisionase family DNA binding protein